MVRGVRDKYMVAVITIFSIITIINPIITIIIITIIIIIIVTFNRTSLFLHKRVTKGYHPWKATKKPKR